MPTLDPVDSFIGAQLRLRRRKLMMSQATLGDRIGVTYQQIQKYESGTNRISAAMLIRAADALEVPPAALLPDGPTVRPDEEFIGPFARDPANRALVTGWMQLTADQRRELLSLVLGLVQKNLQPRRPRRPDD